MLLLMLLAPTLLMRLTRLIECSPQRDSERPSKAGLYSRVKIRVPSVLKERVPPLPPLPICLLLGTPVIQALASNFWSYVGSARHSVALRRGGRCPQGRAVRCSKATSASESLNRRRPHVHF